jgi:ribosome biogenesis GTPase A
MAEKLRTLEAKGQGSKPLRAMVVGIPNVGKSSFINKAAGRKAAAASDRPGVTRGRQWVTVSKGLELLDTPGVLWPKFEDPQVGEHLAFTGAVKDQVLDTEDLAARLLLLLRERAPQALLDRFRLADTEGLQGWELLEAAARNRGFLISGGEADTLRLSNVLLDEFRAGKLGRLTLEVP